MNRTAINSRQFFVKACCFEASLALIAVILGWILDVDPFAALQYSEPSFVIGVAGAVPMILLFHLAARWPNPGFQEIKRLTFETLGPVLQCRHWSDLLLLASIAGFSEEILFRGVIQPRLESAWGLSAGFIGCNLLFGLAHAITPLYIVLAFGIGAYLSAAMDFGDARNLFVPMVIHGLYDFWVLLVLVKEYRVASEKS